MRPLLEKNDKRARVLIIGFSAIIFVLVSFLGRYHLQTLLPFDVHVFAMVNALINSCVAMLLLAGLWAIKNGKAETHRAIMSAAIVLSSLFLMSYIAHHLLAGEARYGDLDRNGVLSEQEKEAAGSIRYLYYFLLATHITLAGLALPMILFTAYRALIGEYEKHKRLARAAWPVWLYVAVTGPLIYWMIRKYY